MGKKNKTKTKKRTTPVAATPPSAKKSPSDLVGSLNPIPEGDKPITVILKGVKKSAKKQESDPKGRLVFLRQTGEGIEVWKDGIPHTYEIFQEEEQAQKLFSHLVSCSHN